jgi:hypothetical protein
MAGVGGRPGWAWIFILEGIATVVAGFLSFWIVQDFPDNAKFLTDVERTVIIRRLQNDDKHSAAGEEFKVKYIVQSLSDWRTYLTSKEDLFLLRLLTKTSLLVLMSAGSASPLFAFALFLPTIINEVSAGIMNSALGSIFTPDCRSDTAPLPPTCSLFPSTSLLVS